MFNKIIGLLLTICLIMTHYHHSSQAVPILVTRAIVLVKECEKNVYFLLLAKKTRVSESFSTVTQCRKVLPDMYLCEQTEIDDNSKVQGKSKPIFVYCDEIGNHLNCMLFCKSMGHTSGHCGGDFICSCF